jgi:hypothetical protein
MAITNKIVALSQELTDPWIQQLDLLSKDKSHFRVDYLDLFNPDSNNYIPKLKDTAIAIYGRDAYDKLKDMHDKGIIHIGLRGFNYTNITALPFITVGDNVRIIISKFPKSTYDHGDVKVEIKGIDDSYFTLFFGGIDKDPPGIPEPHVINMTEGIRILELFDQRSDDWIGLDFETDGFPDRVGFKPLGFSLVSIARDIAYYIDMRSDPIDSVVRQQFDGAFKAFVIKNAYRLIAYNCKFEMTCLWAMYQVTVELQDAYVLCICDDNKKSLKYSAQKYLGCSSWDGELDEQMTAIDQVFKQHRDYTHFMECWDKYNKGELEAVKGYSLRWADYFKSASETQGYIEELFERMKNDWNGNPWRIADPEMMGIYCCYDSARTVQIWDLLYEKYKPSYEVYIYNSYTGFELGISGIPVDTEKREKLTKITKRLITNSALYMNMIYMKWYIEDHKHLIDGFNSNPKWRQLLSLWPELAVSDPTSFGKGLLKRLVDLDSTEIHWDRLSPLIDGDDFSLEYLVMSEALKTEGYSSFFRKKSFYSDFGEFFYNYFDIKGYLGKIFYYNCDKIEIEWDLYTTNFLNKMWIYGSTPEEIHRARVISRSIKKTGEDADLDKLRRSVKKVLKDIQDDELVSLKSIPPLIRDRLLFIFDKYDEEYYLSNELGDILPPNLINKDDILTPEIITNCWSYMDKYPKYEMLSQNGFNYNSETPEDLINEVDSIMNFNSPMETLYFWKMMRSRYLKYIVGIAGYHSFYDGFDDTEKKKHGTMDELRSFVEMYYTTPYFKQSNAYKIAMAEDTGTFGGLKDCGTTLSLFRTNVVYGLITKDEMDFSIPEDPYKFIHKFECFKNLYATCQKNLSTYIKLLWRDSHSTNEVTRQKFQFAYDDGYNNPSGATRYVAGYQINQKNTKRSSLTNIMYCVS